MNSKLYEMAQKKSASEEVSSNAPIRITLIGQNRVYILLWESYNFTLPKSNGYFRFVPSII